MEYLESNNIVTVRFYGKLGATFGRVHKVAVNNCSEAVTFLSAIIPGLEKYLLESESRGVKYAAFYGKQNISEAQLLDNHNGEDIRIAPVPRGGKSPVFTFVLGAVLFFTAPYLAPMIGNTAAFLGFDAINVMLAAKTAIVGFGASLMVSSAVQIISPQQKGLATRDGPDNGSSYNTNGPVNTTAQGNCVPVLYGEMWVGSATISASMTSEDQI